MSRVEGVMAQYFRSYMMHRILVKLMVALVVFCVGMQLFPRQVLAGEKHSALYEQLDLFGQVLELIRVSYLEEPDEVKLIGAAIGGMLTSLDPHSDYLDPAAFEKLKTQTSGKFGGLGIQVTMLNGLIKVISPIDDTPALRAGIMPGDLITHLDDEPIMGQTLFDSVDKMRGDVGASIVLTVKRKGWNDLMKVKIIREIINIDSVRHRVERDDIGYIRITTFNEETSQSLERAIQDIESKVGKDKLRGYVLDLRNNPGGLLLQAVEVSDMFLDKGKIVSIRGRDLVSIKRYNAHQETIVRDKKIFVLINGGSASAAEIVAGALQDQKRAIILGTKSFGKGSVQSIIPLGKHGAARITTARYYTPSGQSIQAKGIKPDVLVKQELPDEWKEFLPDKPKGEAALPGHLEAESDVNGAEEDSGSFAYIPLDPKQDIQLNYAFDVLKGIKKIGEKPGELVMVQKGDK